MYPLIESLLSPFTLGYLLALVVLAELWWKRRLAWRWLSALTLGVLGLGLLTTPAAAYLALGSLEWQYPPADDRPADVKVIVVLSGEVLWPDAIRTKPELGCSTLLRCLKAAELYRDTGPCLVLLSGGRIPDDAECSMAEVMRRFLLKQGVSQSDLLVEPRSKTTHENAVETVRLLKRRGIDKIVLVTDAAHLLRAEACFTTFGLQVVPRGCRYRATSHQWRPDSFLPAPVAAAGVADACHEWIGFLWYWILGYV